MPKMLISVIVATYNRPDALCLVLQSLLDQTDTEYEILIADDGSTHETFSVIENFQYSAKVRIHHVWQPDMGFRLSQIRNLAFRQAYGDYLIFLDGDCIVQPDFIAQHRKLSKPHHVVTGSRILLEKKISERLCTEKIWSFEYFKKGLVTNWLAGEINKIIPLYVKLPPNSAREYRKFVWRRIKGCNLACWKNDAVLINGFDENLIGWGHEDADFVFRLYDNGINRISGAWATEVFHLWHKMADRATANRNAEIVRAKILAKRNNLLA